MEICTITAGGISVCKLAMLGAVAYIGLALIFLVAVLLMWWKVFK